jgi:hypothetical protein
MFTSKCNRGKYVIGLSLLSTLSITTIKAAAQILVDGSENISSLPAHLTPILPSGYTITNLASSGKTGAQMISNYTAQIRPFGASCDAILFEMGGLDLAAGATTNTIKSNITNYYTKASLDFIQVFIRPISPRSTNIGNFTEVNRQAINTWMASTYPSNLIPILYAPEVYYSFDTSWTNYVTGNPWFSNSYLLSLEGLDIEAYGVRHKFQKENCIATLNPTYTAKNFKGMQITGIRGNAYDVQASLNGTSWDVIETIVLSDGIVNWVDISGATNFVYKATAVNP